MHTCVQRVILETLTSNLLTYIVNYICVGDEDAGVYTCVVTLEQMNDTEFEHVFSIDGELAGISDVSFICCLIVVGSTLFFL